MQFSQLHHGSLAVQDLERAATFYREVLGLEEIEFPPTFIPAGLNVRWFKIGSQQIHLLQDPEPHPPSPQHLALQVDDAQAARTHLRAQGLEIGETILIPGADRFFITDPDGNLLELIEWKAA